MGKMALEPNLVEGLVESYSGRNPMMEQLHHGATPEGHTRSVARHHQASERWRFLLAAPRYITHSVAEYVIYRGQVTTM